MIQRGCPFGEEDRSKDGRLLANYLPKSLLLEVRMEEKALAQHASLTQARDTMVRQRSGLKDRVNNIFERVRAQLRFAVGQTDRVR